MKRQFVKPAVEMLTMDDEELLTGSGLVTVRFEVGASDDEMKEELFTE